MQPVTLEQLNKIKGLPTGSGEVLLANRDSMIKNWGRSNPVETPVEMAHKEMGLTREGKIYRAMSNRDDDEGLGAIFGVHSDGSDGPFRPGTRRFWNGKGGRRVVWGTIWATAAFLALAWFNVTFLPWFISAIPALVALGLTAGVIYLIYLRIRGKIK